MERWTVSAPNDRRYLSSHEWHKLDDDTCTIGITKFAADELTDITYVSLPPVGKSVEAGKPFGEVESVKATSELFSGVTGTITQVNTKLNDAPELVNSDSFGEGWMVKIKVKNPAEHAKLLSAGDYEKQLH
jgi:glycine cleavage system H protein